MRGAWWLIAYLGTVVALSWAGSKQFDGRGYIGYGWDQLCVAAAALVFCYWGVRSGWRTPAVEEVEAHTPPRCLDVTLTVPPAAPKLPR